MEFQKFLKENDPRVVLNINNVPLEEWLKAKYEEPQEVKR